MALSRTDCRYLQLSSLFGDRHINELFYEWLQLKSLEPALNDRWYEFLVASNVVPAQLMDMWKAWLIEQGAVGDSVADLEKWFWCNGIDGGGSIIPSGAKLINLPLLTDLYDLSPYQEHATFARNSAATITLHDGSVQTCLPNEARFQGARRVQNLATGVVTETVTVEQNKHYLVCIKGDDGTTAVCSGAFSETVTADGANRITFPNGTALQATTASLTVTVTGTLEQLQVEVAD